MQTVAKTTSELRYVETTIDPKLAASLLARMRPNRNLRRNQVDKYADDIINNRWYRNGQCICVDTDGYLIDGQHRLCAIIKANKPVLMTICSGVEAQLEDGSVMPFDTNIPRSSSDIMGMNGIAGSKAISAIINSMCMFVQDKSCIYVSASRQMEIYKENTTEISFAYSHLYNQQGTRSRGGRNCNVAAAFALYSRVDPEGTDACIKKFTTLEGIVPGDPIKLLINMDSKRLGSSADRLRYICIGVAGIHWSIKGRAMFALKSSEQISRLVRSNWEGLL